MITDERFLAKAIFDRTVLSITFLERLANKGLLCQGRLNVAGLQWITTLTAVCREQSTVKIYDGMEALLTEQVRSRDAEIILDAISENVLYKAEGCKENLD